MKQKYWTKNTSISLINYHFVWIVRRRRKVLIGAIDERLKELITQSVIEIDCEVIAVETHLDHVHLFIQANTLLAPYQIMHKVKGFTAFTLRKEFPELMRLPSMWTRSYFCGTAGAVSGDTIKRYVENQKTK
ncbi:transposase IS200-family protein [Crinalium epipsammum PCC 9333]|uniref:Transposase IS200-family protein n=1 Tax=Crinalium epipsammum PCC 9333 TaxID=1173022 RepID=K9W5T2_9CYAN|nr:IS200/IS605 family transposase [Crinalium epipsammum]AFZ12955.1 transposase IS200-family protein [Crinalium epipsammum PCC 9333]AFZ15154.1 transposase IS200-family protein [Crinalium epipsammum PCC 9333]